MVDTIRTESQLQTLLADNNSRDLSEQDIRDFLVSADLKNLVTKTANYTADADDSVILLNGFGATVQITLPSAVGINGKKYILKCIDKTNACTIATNGAQTIDGAASYTFGAEDDSIVIESDNANWHIIASDLVTVTAKIANNAVTNAWIAYDGEQLFSDATEQTVVSVAFTLTSAADVLVTAKGTCTITNKVRNCQAKLYIGATEIDFTPVYMTANNDMLLVVCQGSSLALAAGSYTAYFKVAMIAGSTYDSNLKYNRIHVTAFYK